MRMGSACVDRPSSRSGALGAFGSVGRLLPRSQPLPAGSQLLPAGVPSAASNSVTIQGTTPYGAAILADSPTAYYRLDDKPQSGPNAIVRKSVYVWNDAVTASATAGSRIPNPTSTTMVAARAT